MIIEKSNFF